MDSLHGFYLFYKKGLQAELLIALLERILIGVIHVYDFLTVDQSELSFVCQKPWQVLPVDFEFLFECHFLCTKLYSNPTVNATDRPYGNLPAILRIFNFNGLRIARVNILAHGSVLTLLIPNWFLSAHPPLRTGHPAPGRRSIAQVRPFRQFGAAVEGFSWHRGSRTQMSKSSMCSISMAAATAWISDSG